MPEEHDRYCINALDCSVSNSFGNVLSIAQKATEEQAVTQAEKMPKVMATFDGVEIYENVNPPIARKWHEFGKPFECVEFVNRYYVKVFGWKNMKGSGDAFLYLKREDMNVFYSGKTTFPPQHGDILVRDKNSNNENDVGHVAIVGNVQISEDEKTATIQVVQQNTYSPIYYSVIKKVNEAWGGCEYYEGGPRFTAWLRRKTADDFKLVAGTDPA